MADFEKGCEECGVTNEKLFRTITNGKVMRLCSRCANANNSLIFEEKKEETKSGKQRTVIKPKAKENFTLSDLYERYWALKKKKENAYLTEKEVVKDIEKKEEKDLDEIKKAVDDLDFDFKSVKIEKKKGVRVRDLLNMALGRKPKQPKPEKIKEMEKEKV